MRYPLSLFVLLAVTVTACDTGGTLIVGGTTSGSGGGPSCSVACPVGAYEDCSDEPNDIHATCCTDGNPQTACALAAGILTNQACGDCPMSVFGVDGGAEWPTCAVSTTDGAITCCALGAAGGCAP